MFDSFHNPPPIELVENREYSSNKSSGSAAGSVVKPLTLLKENQTTANTGSFELATVNGFARSYYNAYSGSGSISCIRPDEVSVATLSPAEIIAEIRTAFSLQVKELAEIVGVQRPHVYSWINEESKPRGHNSDKLSWLYGLAKQWNAICAIPCGDSIRAVAQDGKSLLSLLKTGPIAEVKISYRLNTLAAECRRFKALPASPPNARDIASKRGMTISGTSDQQDILDAMTGKRSHAD